MQCKFIDGKINGVFTSYYKYPEIAIYCEYNNGNIIKDSFIFYSYRYFNCNFIKYIKTNFVNNKENGMSKIYQRTYAKHLNYFLRRHVYQLKVQQALFILNKNF